MFAFAESEIELSLPPPGADSATTQKTHLLQVYKQTGKLPKPLAEQPPLPEVFAHLWEWFLEINNAEPLTYSEIECWSRLTHRNLTGREAGILKQLDGLKWKIIHGRNRNISNPGKKRGSGRR